MSLKLYSIDTNYVDFLRRDQRLLNVFDNKDTDNSHGRKYLGILLSVEGHDFYAPLSSPKDTDYLDQQHRLIRKSILPIIRITKKNASGERELLGTIKLSNMIRVPNGVSIAYDISFAPDLNYRNLVWKEYSFIVANEKMILSSARALYRQKIGENDFEKRGEKKPGYLKSTVDFSYALERCLAYLPLPPNKKN